MGELLKSAIADAKAIRETALANARMALEEAFAPTLEKMISDKINADVMSEDGEEGEEGQEGGEFGGEAPVAPAPEPDGDEFGGEAPVAPAPEPDGDESPEIEVPAGEGEEVPPAPATGEEGLDDIDLLEGGAGTKVTGDAGNDPEKAKGSKTTVSTLHETEEDESSLDLNSIIRELEEDAEEEEEEVDETVQFGGKVTSDAGNDPEGKKGKNKPYKGGKEDMSAIKEGEEGEEEEVDEKYNFEKSKKDDDEDGVDEKVEKYNFSKPKANPVKEGEEEEIDLDEILRELEMGSQDENPTDGNPMGGTPPEQPGFEGDEELEAENTELKQQLGSVTSALEEHRKVVAFLKSKLNEVNLLNAKLLFTNKLFKSHALNNAQKMKVIENFDRARNLREVKLVYATIAESLSQTDLAKKSGKVITKLTEGIASRVQKSTKPAVVKVIKQSSIIDDGSADRLKLLAGITKKK